MGPADRRRRGAPRGASSPACSTIYRDRHGLGSTKRSHQFGAAQSQILIDSPRSSLVDLTQETPPLATRAAVYTQFMRSNAVKEAISKASGIPADLIVAQGPYTTAGGSQNLPRPSEARANEVRSEKRGYRLVFDYQQDLPIVSIYAQAPTAKSAIALAAGTVAGVRSYISQLERQQKVPASAQDPRSVSSGRPRAGPSTPAPTRSWPSWPSSGS